MDGVPGVTQSAVVPGGEFIYEFTAEPAGTFFFHSHFGLQLEHGLYASLIIEPKQEPQSYDREYVLVLDDWPVRSPEAMLAIANCQAELKDAKGARKTIDDLVKTYPKSEAAQAGRERLASLK